MMNDVVVCEVGPRDGLQMAKGVMPTASKLRWIDAMVQAGVHDMEVGSFVPPQLIPQMADTEAVIRSLRRKPMHSAPVRTWIPRPTMSIPICCST